MSESSTFDLFVIGAGSGGVRAARLAAARGLRVAVAEPAPLGGTCVNLGCIPKKLYRYAADYADAFAESRGFGWSLGDIRFDWATLKSRRAAEITRLNGIYERLLIESGVTLMRSRATLGAPGSVVVAGASVRARHVLVATGGRPHVPQWPGAALAVTSDAMFDLPTFPRRLVVIGGGYIACEFASIFRGLGAEVVQLLRGDGVLRGFDADVRTFVAQEMARSGILFRTGAVIDAIEALPDGARRVCLRGGDGVEADTVLAATGRVPNTAGLGLAEAGVALGADGAIVVDAGYATGAAGVHAIGDVVGRLALTPVALAEAGVLVDRLTGGAQRVLDYERIATAVFTHPTIGTVGLGEEDARAKHGAVRVFRSDFRPLRHTLSGSEERTMVKVIVDAANDRVLGMHMVGAEAGEIVQGFAAAMTAGITKAQLDATVGIHPTAAEEFVTLRQALR